MIILNRFSAFIKSTESKITLSIGEVELVDKIGQGGNGIVYSGKSLNNVFAIKFLLSDATGKMLQTKKQRFLAEYFNVVTLNYSKGIVRYVDFDILKIEDEEGILEIPVILMKLYAKSLAKETASSSDDFVNLSDFLLSTVESIHDQGIIHRDIKPENILLDKEEFVLADFGIANYNPEIFELRAQTDSKERIGNRLFSAPEQENTGVTAHPTMDIYAIGQVLQWYATGETHRGTNRKKIKSVFNNLRDYDYIIEKCLSNNPEDRFQSIKEIKDFFKELLKKEPNVWKYIYNFGEVLVSNFPKNETGIIHSDNISRIDRLFQSFKDQEELFENHLWWHDGLGNIDFRLKNKGSGIWKFGDSEYKIKELWIHYDNSFFNDFILVHYDKSEPFMVNGKETYYTAIVDGENHISYSEYQNGFAEINDEIITLSEHHVEFIERQKDEGYFFIATRFHCVLRTRNDKTVWEFIDKIKLAKGILKSEEFKTFEREIRKHKHREVLISL